MKEDNMKRKNSGFTFIELLVVMTIIGVVFASGVVTYSTITQKSRDAKRKADIEAIRQSLEMCRSLTGGYPVSITNTVTCTGGTPVLLSKTPTDPKPCGSPAVSNYTYSNVTATTYTLTATCTEIGAPISVTQP